MDKMQDPMMEDDGMDNMPDEVESVQDEEKEAKRLSILATLGASISKKIKDAVNDRAASGIETEWIEDEEFYQGFDDANRSEFGDANSKPSNTGGATHVTVSGTDDESSTPQSTVFPNITQQYVDAAAARVGDVLLPTGEDNFILNATPIPDMGLDQFPDEPEEPQQVPQAEQGLPPVAPSPQPGMPQGDPQGMPPASPAMPSAPPQAGTGKQFQMADGKVVSLAEAKAKFAKMKADADRKAEKAQLKISDWLTECQYHGELRNTIHDAAMIGTGVIKGPVPVRRKSQKWLKGEDGVHKLVILEEIKPASFRVNPKNIFPDPACGESIHNGSYIVEYDSMTPKRLADFIGVPGYLEDQINVCLEEGPQESSTASRKNAYANSKKSTKGLFDIWYYHGEVTTDELEMAGCDCEYDDTETMAKKLIGGKEVKPRKKSYPAVLTLVNDRVIRASLNPLDNGDFPYDFIPWKKRPGTPWGSGVARQMRTPQRLLTSTARHLADNLAYAAGPQFMIRRGAQPENGIWEIAPLKIWTEDSNADGQNSAPINAIVIPILEEPLMRVMQWAMDLAERSTGLPMLLQGQMGSAPNTATGTNILNNNGNSLLKRIALLFDNYITEPHIRRYYAFLMTYGDDDDEKGDFQVWARGSTALVEREVQSQEMAQIVQMCMNPAFGKNPEKAMDEYLKMKRFDPSAFDYTEEEKKAKSAQQTPPPPQIEVAQIHEKGLAERQKADLQFKASESALDRGLEQAIKQLDVRLESQSLTSEERIALEKQKVLLASVTLRLQVQERMSTNSMTNANEQVAQNHLVDLHKYNKSALPQAIAPMSEPSQQAPAGQAFQQ